MEFTKLSEDVQNYIAAHEKDPEVLEEIALSSGNYEPLVSMMQRDDILEEVYEKLARIIIKRDQNAQKAFSERSFQYAMGITGSSIVLETIADNTYCIRDEEMLTALAKNRYDNVRITMARSDDLHTAPNSIQMMLASDENNEVLFGVAMESNYDEAIALAYKNGDEEVKSEAVFNDFASQDIIKDFIETLNEHVSCADDCMYLIRECNQKIALLMSREDPDEKKAILYGKLQNRAGERAEEYSREDINAER